ncbi:MAG: hypothetical protein HZA90_04945 [Verrucomicrobia bacterium]|nr:hypothetical protein [Verrucomicrobiota bacterium]
MKPRDLSRNHFGVLCHSLPVMLLLLLPTSGPADDSVTAFGLRWEAHPLTSLALDENGQPTTTPSSETNASYGLRVVLGEADSGFFGYPQTDYENEEYWMQGVAYGKLDGQTNQMISSVRADPYYESYTYNGQTYRYHLTGTYLVTPDLSPLGGRSLTFTLYTNEGQVATTTAHCGQVLVDYYHDGYWGQPRVNPFWRMPDGSVGVLIELNNSARVVLPGQNRDETWLTGNRVFIRADAPTRRVDFVSHVDVTANAGLPWFNCTDARLGVFRRPHKALGQTVFAAAGGKLTLNNLGPGDGEGALVDGMAVELNEPKAFAGPTWVNDLGGGAGGFSLDLALLELGTNGAALRLDAMTVSANGLGDGAGFADLVRHDGALQIVANLTGDLLGVAVYDQGHKVGESVLPDSAGVLTIVVPATNGPSLTGCGVRAASAQAPAGYSFHFDRPTTFTATNGFSLTGDEIKLQALCMVTNPGGLAVTSAVPVASLQTFLLTAANVPPITIHNEVQSPVETPPLSCHRSGWLFTASWRDPNNMFVLESGLSVEGAFALEEFSYDPLTQTGQAVLDLREEPSACRFFRLRSVSQPYYD